jgi:phage tail P2-like protein
MSDLLPANASPQERAIEASIARIGDVPTAVIRDQWDPWACPPELLPWLAWAFNVDEWDAEWPDQAKRQTIADSIELHRRKGSIDSIRRVLRNAGYGDAVIIEGSGAKYDGANLHDGLIDHGDPTGWAQYRIILGRAITNRQAAQVRRLLSFTAPARCELVALIFTQANNIYNGAIFHDGNFNHGIA